MRLFKIIIISCLLLLFLSLFVNAMGNDYTFSPSYWFNVFSNTVLVGDNLVPFNVFSDMDLSVRTLNSEDSYFSLTNDYMRYCCIWQQSNQYLSSYNYQIPINISVTRRSELIFCFYLLTDRIIQNISFDLVTSSGSYSMSCVYDRVDVKASNPTYIDVVYTAPQHGYIINVSFTNDLTSSILADYVDLNISFSGDVNRGPLLLGVLCDHNNSVVLPESFILTVENIHNRLQDVYVRVNDMRTTLNELNSTAELMKDNSDTTVEQLNSIQSLIDELSDKLSSSGSVSQQIYQTLTVPTPEVSQAVTQLEQTVAQAKQELAEINETIKIVVLPSIDDVDEVVSVDTSQSLDEALGNNDVRSTLSTVFSFGQFSSMLLIMLTIATVGYILYGKKG